MRPFELVNEKVNLIVGKFNSRGLAVSAAVRALLEDGVTEIRITAAGDEVVLFNHTEPVYKARIWTPKRAPNGSPKTAKVFRFAGAPSGTMWRRWTDRAEADIRTLEKHLCPAAKDGEAYLFYIDFSRRYVGHECVGKPVEEAKRLLQQRPGRNVEVSFNEGGYSLCENLPPAPEKAVAGFLAMRTGNHWKLLGKRYENYSDVREHPEA